MKIMKNYFIIIKRFSFWHKIENKFTFDKNYFFLPFISDVPHSIVLIAFKIMCLRLA